MANMLSPVAMCLRCCSCLGPIIVRILLLGSGVRKQDSSGDRDNPSKTFQHDGLLVIKQRGFDR